jgi:hypothetical protein
MIRNVETQQRLLKFVTRANWLLFLAACLLGGWLTSPGFARGILFGGLIVTVNFHLLYRTLKKAFTPPNLASHHAVLAKYYIRFGVSAVIIFFLISKHVVEPLGLIFGLSIVVVSIICATMFEITKIIFKEAV